MDKKLIKHFQDGITIDKLKNGKYSVFTVKTQRFTINTLEELIPDAFENAIVELDEKRQLEKKVFDTEKFVDECITDAIIYTTKNIFFPQDFTYNLFDQIANEPRKTEITASGGEKTSVGSKFKLTLMNDTEFDVHIMEATQQHRSAPEDAKVLLMMGYNGAFQIFTVREMKKRIKKLERIL